MKTNEKSSRFKADELHQFASQVFAKAGIENDKATCMAETLLESDLMGHTTHGLALLKPYLISIEQGHMTKEGEPEVIQDTGASVTWNGRRLPGAWLTHQAIDLAFERIKEHPVITIAIQQSHHIGCLAAYPERATDKGLMMLLSCSDPGFDRVAPYGGTTGAYSPNPIAAGIPTSGLPIIFDISTSETAAGMVNQSHKSGKRLPHPWLLDNKGQATDDPATFYDPAVASTILPLGGLSTGYKGFALGIMVEAMTTALSGHGRADGPIIGWLSSVFLQIIDPDAFAGSAAFTTQMDHLVKRCLTSAVPEGKPPVRLPGQRALGLRNQYREEGVPLMPFVVDGLEQMGKLYHVQMPEAL
ncbi:MAG: Ldh family oxidoreductase [Saprospiraceae bacterium]|nr:Ldh family oxidoreductase [Saprospiraceae bacterium]